jgi:hypothetical protein
MKFAFFQKLKRQTKTRVWFFFEPFWSHANEARAVGWGIDDADQSGQGHMS